MERGAVPEADVVLEGGGIKGIALAGAVAGLAEAGVAVRRWGGSSAGAIVAALAAAGYDTEAELRDLLVSAPFASFADPSPLDRIPFIGPIGSVVFQLGWYEGNAVEDWVRARLAERGVSTFADFALDRDDPANDNGFAHRLQVVIADVTRRQVLVLPRDAAAIGMAPDEVDVAWAVRASGAIPLFYEPTEVRVDGRSVLLVDGGLLSNFPVWLFDRPDPRWPTIGLNLVESSGCGDPIDRAPETDRPGIVGYLGDIIGTLIEARDKLDLAAADAVRTIDVPNLGVGTTDFDIDRDTAESLFSCGLAAVRDWEPPVV